MKKMLVLIGMLTMISVASFADLTCPVRNSNNNVASLESTTYEAYKPRTECPYVYITINLSDKSEGETTVFVEVMDSAGNIIKTVPVTISDGRKQERRQFTSCDFEEGATYKFSIARASCSWY